MGGGNSYFIIIYIVIIIAVMYFFMIRPGQKQNKQKQQLMNDLQIGDLVKTSSGFYGEVIDITDEMIIVEFGNNKNCRIPMDREAIVDIEKANKND